MMNNENKTDGRAHKLPRLSFFFVFSSHTDLLVSFFFPVFISPFVVALTSCSLSFVRTRKKRETRQILTYCQPIEENQLMYDQKQLVDFDFIFLKNRRKYILICTNNNNKSRSG
jgi:hypothetical protein